MKLFPKITLLILLALICTLSILSYIIISSQKKELNSFLQREGNLLVDSISASSLEFLLVEDFPLLETYLQRVILNNKNIVFIKIIKNENIVARVSNNKSYGNITDLAVKKASSYKNFGNIVKFYGEIILDGDYVGGISLGLSDYDYSLKYENKIKQFLALIFISSILIFLILTYIIKKYLLEHINTLKTYLNEIGQGNYTKKNLINTKDEFSDLNDDINSMLEKIDTTFNELNNLTKKLKIQKYELIEANQARDDFLANVSHELRTPLNSINVISEVMSKNKKGNLDNKQIKNIEIVNKCGKELLSLINDILDISKLEAGQVILDNKEFEIKPFIIDIYEMFKLQAKEKKIDLIYDIEDSLNTIYCDDTKLKHIIKNLISNALKFTQNGQIRVIVKDINENIKFIISDDGIGIPKEKLKNVFDRFKQADGSTTRKFGGTGLGLAISKELTMLLKGELFVKSELNKGSDFTLIIPKNIENNSKIIIDDNVNVKEEMDIDKIERIIIPSKEEIYLLNNDPINLFSMSIELSSLFKVHQETNLETLVKRYKNNRLKVLVYIDKISDKELEIIKSNFMKEDLILFFDILFKENLEEIGCKILKRPLKASDLI